MLRRDKNKSRPHERIAIIGRIPPPYGGVSMHLSRWLDLLEKEEIHFLFCDLEGKHDPDRAIVPMKPNIRFLFRFLQLSCKAVHLHTSKLNQLTALLAVARFVKKCPCIITFHNQRLIEEESHAPAWLRYLFRTCIKRRSFVVATNENIRAWCLEELGLESEKITYAPAFLPPSEQEMRFDDYPEEVEQFFQHRSPIIGSQGFFGSFYEGKHIYQFELLGHLLAKVLKTHPRAGCYTALSGCLDQSHRKTILELRQSLGLENHWMFQQLPLPAAPLFSRCRLFLRPTMTDGDSVSVRECLLMGVPVIASDSVRRPDGVLVYQQGNTQQLEEMTLKVLDGELPSEEQIRQARISNKKAKAHGDSLLQLYRKF